MYRYVHTYGKIDVIELGIKFSVGLDVNVV